MNLKFLHIVSDEKFPDSAYRQFEKIAPGASVFILPETRKPIQHLKEIIPLRVSKFSFLSPRFIKYLEKYDAVILHSMTNFALELVGRASAKTKFVWIGMGFDYYDLVYKDPYDMLEAETSEIVKDVLPEFGKSGVRNFVKRTLKLFVYPNARKKKLLIQRVNLFCPVLVTESRMLKRELGQFLPKTVPWNYGVLGSMIDGSSDFSEGVGANILVGNSATPTNNHVEVFRMLGCIDIPKDAKIVVPLNYGDAPYRRKILELGRRMFGTQFHPVTDFLGFDQYVLLLKSCSVMVMNHKRQQGAGNINIGIYLGAKVFLNSSSPLYEHYQSMGVEIFPTAGLEKILQDGVNGLSAASAAGNRKILQREYSSEARLQKTGNLIKEIMQQETLARI